MSRYVITRADGPVVAYGHDHACGYFFQFWGSAEAHDSGDAPHVDLDSLSNGLTGARLWRWLGHAEVTDRVPSEHRAAMLLDEKF